jgi:lipooligosaccharide transport system permease protein
MSTPILAGDAVVRHGGSGRLAPGVRRPQSRLERVSAAVAYHHRVYLRTWRGTLIGRFASPLFFLAAMGLGLGGLVDDQVGGIDGVPYLQYVAGGIVAMQAMWLAFGESTYPVMTYIRWNQMYAGMLATPLSVVEVLLGHLAYVAFHLATTTAIFLVVAAAFGAFTSPWVVLAVPICVLVGLAFAVPMFAFSAHIDNDNAFALLFRFLVTPVMLFSGVFFPIDQLPVLLQPVAWALPLGHGVELVRAVSGGLALTASDLGHVAVLAAYVGVGWVLARRSFRKRLAA